MTPEVVVNLGQQALQIMLMVGSPLLLSALLTGLVSTTAKGVDKQVDSTLGFGVQAVVMMVTKVKAQQMVPMRSSECDWSSKSLREKSASPVAVEMM